MPSLATLDYGPSSPIETPVADTPASSTDRPEAATTGVFSRFIEYGSGRWRRRSLRRAFTDAQLALGERMYAAGIDDGELGAQIALVDNEIRRAEAAKAPTKAQRVERVQLLMRLAAVALEEDAPLPGADEEYEAARQAQAALLKDGAGLTA